MILIYVFEKDENPAALSKLLWQHKVGHRILHKDGKEELWLVDSTQAAYAQSLISNYVNGERPSANSETAIANQSSSLKKVINHLWAFCYRFPVTSGVLFFSLVVTLITGFGRNLEITFWFLFVPVGLVDGQLYFLPFSIALENAQYWRLITPAFLHFSVIHICFNLLWMWDIGRKVEQGVGSLLYFLGVLLIAVTANCLQYFIGQSAYFGGMSGVVYAVIGFAWLLPKLNPSYHTLISQPLMAVLMVFFALGYTDFFSMIGFGDIANTAHLSGLVLGLISALLFNFYKKAKNKRLK